MKNNKITLILTKVELIALTDILDSFSALTDSIEGSSVSKKDLKKIDKMLLKNGWKRIYS